MRVGRRYAGEVAGWRVEKLFKCYLLVFKKPFRKGNFTQRKENEKDV
ncbi:hypothetical protein [Campylobacter vulpis]|nr:hypothetical protein [Campylobacter vulpis]